MRLGLQNLLQDRLRFVFSVVGIVLAVMLILFLLGLRSGIREGQRTYLSHAPGKAVVLPTGVKSTLAGSGQFLPAGTAETVATSVVADHENDGKQRVSWQERDHLLHRL